MLGGQRLEQVHDLGDRAADVHGLERDGHRPGLDPRDLEHLVDQLEQVVAALEDQPDVLALDSSRSSISISCAKPRIEFSGVRSSWLMRERKSLRALCSFSASSWRASFRSTILRSVTSWAVPTIFAGLPFGCERDLTVRVDDADGSVGAHDLHLLVERLAPRERAVDDRLHLAAARPDARCSKKLE